MGLFYWRPTGINRNKDCIDLKHRPIWTATADEKINCKQSNDETSMTSSNWWSWANSKSRRPYRQANFKFWAINLVTIPLDDFSIANESQGIEPELGSTNQQMELISAGWHGSGRPELNKNFIKKAQEQVMFSVVSEAKYAQKNTNQENHRQNNLMLLSWRIRVIDKGWLTISRPTHLNCLALQS